MNLTETITRFEEEKKKLKREISQLQQKVYDHERSLAAGKEEVDKSKDYNTAVEKQSESLKKMLLKNQEIEELHHRVGDGTGLERLSEDLEKWQNKFRKCEEERLESLQMVQKSEMEQRKVVQQYKLMIQELNEKSHRKLKKMEEYAYKQIENLQRSQEQEKVATEKKFSDKIETMKSQISKLKQSHSNNVEKLKRQHDAEVAELKRGSRGKDVVTRAQVCRSVFEVRKIMTVTRADWECNTFQTIFLFCLSAAKSTDFVAYFCGRKQLSWVCFDK